MEKLFWIFCFLTLFFVYSVNGKYTKCGGFATISKVICNDNDMQTTDECILKKGANSSLTVVFKAEKDIKSLKSVCHGVIAGLPVAFNGIDPNGCNGIEGGCPLAAGKTYTFKAQIPVKKIYPALRLLIKWEEMSDPKTKTDDWCLIVPARIQ